MINTTVFFNEEHTSNIFVNSYSLWDMEPAALKSFNHTIDCDSMSNQYPQTTTDKPRTDLCPVFSSLHTMDSKS